MSPTTTTKNKYTTIVVYNPYHSTSVDIKHCRYCSRHRDTTFSLFFLFNLAFFNTFANGYLPYDLFVCSLLMLNLVFILLIMHNTFYIMYMFCIWRRKKGAHRRQMDLSKEHISTEYCTSWQIPFRYIDFYQSFNEICKALSKCLLIIFCHQKMIKYFLLHKFTERMLIICVFFAGENLDIKHR